MDRTTVIVLVALGIGALVFMRQGENQRAAERQRLAEAEAAARARNAANPPNDLGNAIVDTAAMFAKLLIDGANKPRD